MSNDSFSRNNARQCYPNDTPNHKPKYVDGNGDDYYLLKYKDSLLLSTDEPSETLPLVPFDNNTTQVQLQMILK
jgi:hypothetical protein